MESVDTEYYKSLLWIKENDPSELGLTFQGKSYGPRFLQIVALFLELSKVVIKKAFIIKSLVEYIGALLHLNML